LRLTGDGKKKRSFGEVETIKYTEGFRAEICNTEESKKPQGPALHKKEPNPLGSNPWSRVSHIQDLVTDFFPLSNRYSSPILKV
jgi:hypothetical protein